MRSDPQRCLEPPKRLVTNPAKRLGRWVVALALVALPVVWAGCAPPADQVELRLYPCMFGDDQPRSVVVEIIGYDAEGIEVETHEVAFDNIAADVFADGYATVGYRPGVGVVTADFRLGWSSAPSIGSIDEAEREIDLPMQTVPPLGEVLDIGDGAGGGCEPIAGDGDPSGDGDGDMTGDGDGDMTTTGDGDGDMTGDGDGDMGSPVQPGDPCNGVIQWGCAPEPNEQAGTPLQCINDMYMSANGFADACSPGICPGGTSPVEACGGFGQPASCMCLPDNNPQSCDGAQLGCDGDTIHLCFEGQVVSGTCFECEMNGEYYSCPG